MKLWPGNNPSSSPFFAPIMLVAVILAVYYPAMLSGIHPYDDPAIITRYSAALPLSQVLLPGNSYYYRPLVELSFYLDNLLWGMEPAVMHLESILLHCANSLLVFLLICKLIDQDDDRNRFIPLAAAFLFAMYPVNVEAIAWIAGRTDPLLTLFVLSSTCFWLSWLKLPRWQDMIAALMLFGAALLTKETALAFGAVVVVITAVWPGTATIRQRMIAMTIMVLPALLLIIIALGFQGGTSGLSRFLAGTNLQLGQGLQDALIAFGFYLKKLINPFPLNFAIDQVQPLYGLAGVAFFPLLWWCWLRQRQASVLFIATALFILPAVLVAVKPIAWTPLAERYLYLPSAFFMAGLSVFVSKLCATQKKIVLLVAVCLAVIFAVTSFQRTLLWDDKLAFFQDAVAKSPGFGSVYYSLGGILAQKGEINRAYEFFVTAEQLNKRDSMRYPIKAAIMGAKLNRGELLETRKYFYGIFSKKSYASADFLELLCKADGKRIGGLTGREKVLLAEDLLETLDLLNQKRPDPFWLYRSGQVALIAGDTKRAADFFQRAYAAAPADAHYRGAAKIYLLMLEGSR